MFGIFKRFRVYLIMFAAFAAFAGVAYWYYQDTQKALQTYAQNQATLESSLQFQRQATESLQRDIVMMQSTITELNDAFSQSRERVNELEDKFNTSANGDARDIGEIAEKRPESVERVINKGTRDVNRCIELLSGATPIQEDYNNEELVDCISTD